MADLIGTFRKPFPEQIAAFRTRIDDLRPTRAWNDLWQSEHDRAFMVAGAMKADLLADLAGAVDRAISEGTGIEAFRRDFREIVERRGWHGWTGEGTKRGEAWRTRVIYKTNMSTSYAAGRWAQLMAAGYPLLVYRHGGSVDPRPEHLGWDGLILPADHPFWITHAPPNGWGCSCFVLGARSLRDAVRKGGKPHLSLPEDWRAIDPKSGAPFGIDKGWAYAPGASVSENVSQLAQKIAKLPASLGSELATSVERQIHVAWQSWVQRVTNGETSSEQLIGVIPPTVLTRLGERGVSPATAEIMVRPGLLVGPKAQRHEDAGDALSLDHWMALARLIRAPRTVLLDERSGALIFLLDGDGRVPQIAVRLDYRRDRRGEKLTFNALVSAYLAQEEDLQGRLRGGLLSLILGSLG